MSVNEIAAIVASNKPQYFTRKKAECLTPVFQHQPNLCISFTFVSLYVGLQVFSWLQIIWYCLYQNRLWNLLAAYFMKFLLYSKRFSYDVCKSSIKRWIWIDLIGYSFNTLDAFHLLIHVENMPKSGEFLWIGGHLCVHCVKCRDRARVCKAEILKLCPDAKVSTGVALKDLSLFEVLKTHSTTLVVGAAVGYTICRSKCKRHWNCWRHNIKWLSNDAL